MAYPTPVDFDGSLLRWDIAIGAAPILYEIVAKDEQDRQLFQNAVDDAAALWSNVPSAYFALAPAQSGDTAQVTVHLEAAIDGAAYSAGYAIFDEYDGAKPVHCSIHVTVDQSVSYVGFAKTVLHELGHCAGLGHTLIPEAIMSYSLDANAFALDVDDEAALTRLYPADGSSPKLPPGCAVGADREGRSTMLILWLLVWPLVFALLRSRSRPSSRSRRQDRLASDVHFTRRAVKTENREIPLLVDESV